MHDFEVEMHNCEKLLEDQRVCMNHSNYASWRNMEYYRNQIFVWLDKYEENSEVRYFVKKCVEDEHMTKPYETWSPTNRGASLSSCHTMS